MVQGRSSQVNDVSAFKNELKNYLYYKEKIKEIEEEVEEIYRIMSGIIGKEIGEPVRNTNQELKEERRLELIENIARQERKIKHYKSKIEYIEKVLNKCSYRDAMIRIYCLQEGYVKLGREFGYSPRGLQKRIDKEIKNAISPH